MNLKNDYLIPLLASIGLVTTLILLAVIYFLFKQTKLSSESRSLTWEDCVKDSRSVILEMYPARCSIAGIGSVTQPLSEEEKKKLLPPIDSSCQNDSDCVLVVSDSWNDCSLLNSCQPVDYSLEKWVAVNQEQFAAKIKGCEIMAMMCDPKPINDKFEAKCENNVCRKVAQGTSFGGDSSQECSTDLDCGSGYYCRFPDCTTARDKPGGDDCFITAPSCAKRL